MRRLRYQPEPTATMTIESNEQTRARWRATVQEMRPIVLANLHGNRLMAAEGKRIRRRIPRQQTVTCPVCGNIPGSPECKGRQDPLKNA